MHHYVRSHESVDIQCTYPDGLSKNIPTTMDRVVPATAPEYDPYTELRECWVASDLNVAVTLGNKDTPILFFVEYSIHEFFLQGCGRYNTAR